MYFRNFLNDRYMNNKLCKQPHIKFSNFLRERKQSYLYLKKKPMYLTLQFVFIIIFMGFEILSHFFLLKPINSKCKS